MSERANERTNEQTNERTNEKTNGRTYKLTQTIDNERFRERSVGGMVTRKVRGVKITLNETAHAHTQEMVVSPILLLKMKCEVKRSPNTVDVLSVAGR